MSGVTPEDKERSWRECVNNHRGFTLLELLVVMTIATLVLVIVPVRFSAMVPHVESQAEIKRLVLALRAARGMAIRESREVYVTLDLAHQQYALPGSAQMRPLPKNFKIKYLAPFTPSHVTQLVEIHFFSDGSSSGGRIDMTAKDAHYEITIDWLTGRIGYLERNANET